MVCGLKTRMERPIALCPAAPRPAAPIRNLPRGGVLRRRDLRSRRGSRDYRGSARSRIAQKLEIPVAVLQEVLPEFLISGRRFAGRGEGGFGGGLNAVLSEAAEKLEISVEALN